MGREASLRRERRKGNYLRKEKKIKNLTASRRFSFVFKMSRATMGKVVLETVEEARGLEFSGK